MGTNKIIAILYVIIAMLLMEMQTAQLLWIALFLCVLQLHYSIVHAAEDDFGLAGYLPDYRIHGYNLNASIPHYLTDLLLFSIQPHKSGMITGVCCLQGDHWELIQTSKMNHNPSLHLWVTIGGAGRADAIPFITKSSAKRQRLITSMVELSQQQKLYGIDLDIYYPTSQDELRKYMTFVQEASQAWHQAGLKISVTWHPHRLQLPKPIFDLVDRVHLMAYDMIQKVGDYHASLADTQKAVESLLQQGCPSQKIWLGIPMYGRKLNNPGEAETFGALYQDWLKVAQSQSADSLSEHNGFAWDSPNQIRAKMDYAYKMRQVLGGVFFWELGQDFQDPTIAPGGLLLEAAWQHRKQLLASNTADGEL